MLSAQGWSSAASEVAQGTSQASDGYSSVPMTSASSEPPLPTTSAPVTVKALNPSQTYNKAIGTLQTYGASVQSLSQYVSSKYASDESAGSSFLSSVTASAQQSNTVHQFNEQGSATGTANPADPNETSGVAHHVPAGRLTALCSCIVALLGAGVVFL